MGFSRSFSFTVSVAFFRNVIVHIWNYSKVSGFGSIWMNNLEAVILDFLLVKENRIDLWGFQMGFRSPGQNRFDLAWRFYSGFGIWYFLYKIFQIESNRFLRKLFENRFEFFADRIELVLENFLRNRFDLIRYQISNRFWILQPVNLK
jgi:hypothetical protein